MSRRYSPRALNSRTDASDAESFSLEYDYDEAWTAALDSSDNLFEAQDDDSEDDDYIELTESEYDNDWDDYWREQRNKRSRAF